MSDLSGFNVRDKLLPCRTVKVSARPAVIGEEHGVRKMVLFTAVEQDGLLGLDAHAVTMVFIVIAETHICGIVRLFHGKNPPSNRNNPRLQYFVFIISQA